MKRAVLLIIILTALSVSATASPYGSFRFGIEQESMSLMTQTDLGEDQGLMPPNDLGEDREVNVGEDREVYSHWGLLPYIELEFGVEWGLFNVWGLTHVRMNSPIWGWGLANSHKELFDPQLTWYIV